MITFLSSPKKFAGSDAANQVNAIQSWRSVHPEAEVILYGDSPGTRDVCERFGLVHVAEVASSPSGVPCFDAIVEHARREARYDIQVYLNCDILLDRHVLDAASAVTLREFLIIGQRIDLWAAADGSLRPGREAGDLKALVTDPRARLHPPAGMDYFVFPRGLWEGLKPLVIGRVGYDSALVAFCLRRGIPVIDATHVIPAAHQFHDYGHVKGGAAVIMAGADARQNQRLHRVAHSSPNVADATWRLTGAGLVPNHARGDVLRQLETRVRYKLKLVAASYAIRALWRVLTGLKLYRPRAVALSDVIDQIYGKSAPEWTP